jgi:predicted nucleotidyltransferase
MLNSEPEGMNRARICEEMREHISQKLDEIEQRENVVILHAVESGSRAWGFASPDSDYDVRFIYVRSEAFYLKLGKTRDVIEWQIDEILDISGWDLQKALRLLHSSNPTLFEWASSPIVYRTTSDWRKISDVFNDYFLTKPGVYHYLSMAERNYREYLKRDTVRVKKYFYVIRPLLACKWILRKGSPPPMLFSDLVKAEADAELFSEIERLSEIKTMSSETKEIPQITVLNQYIEETIPLLKAQIGALPHVKSKTYDELDVLFFRTVNCETTKKATGTMELDKDNEGMSEQAVREPADKFIGQYEVPEGDKWWEYLKRAAKFDGKCEDVMAKTEQILRNIKSSE